MKYYLPIMFISIVLITASFAEGQETMTRHLFDFKDASKNQWQIVNDGVMGGLSTSKVAMTKDESMQYSGNLSLKNNGGFASVRSKPKTLKLNSGDKIMIRVKGDGRKYTFNLYIPTRRPAFSYQRDFKTTPGKWVDVELPLSEFQAMSFGQKVDEKLNPAGVNSVGILLGDKKEGPFEIVIDHIKVVSPKSK